MVSWSSFEWFGHHKLLRMVRVEANVINEEPLRIGAGKVASVFEPVDLVVVKVFDPKTGKYIPFIPGSSWKGVFRAHAVKISKTCGLGNVCEGIPNSTCLEGKEFYDYERHGVDERTKIELILQGSIKCCLLCLIFGTPGIFSHVVFHDSMPIFEPKLGYRTMTAISRRTGTVKPGALYSVEYVEPGSKFTFSLEAINLPNYAIGLLMNVIKHIDLGLVKVGGMKTRGFGKVHFENYKLSVYTIDDRYGVVNGKLKALDPIDSDITWSKKAVVKDKEAEKVIDEFINAWNKALPLLKKINDANWRWGVIGE